MMFMVELHYSKENREAALRYFLEHGTTHYEGKVTLKDVWAATQDHIAYVLASAADDSEMEKACEPLRQFGEVTFRHVTSADEI